MVDTDLPFTTYYTGSADCAKMDETGSLRQIDCTVERPFICETDALQDDPNYCDLRWTWHPNYKVSTPAYKTFQAISPEQCMFQCELEMNQYPGCAFIVLHKPERQCYMYSTRLGVDLEIAEGWRTDATRYEYFYLQPYCKGEYSYSN